jgi:SAM-dependent methyltransferase
MLRIANVGANDHLIDLGSGDGRIVILAAKRAGASGLGVEIDPRLVQSSIQNAQNAGVAQRTRFVEQDLFKTDLSPATVVTMYLLPDVNLKLRPSLLALKPGTRIVSHDWDMGDWKPDQSTVLPVPDKKVGLSKSSTVHLWVVPAQVEGLWCGRGLIRGASILLKQRFQEYTGTLGYIARRDKLELQGRILGNRLFVNAGRPDELVLEAAGNALKIISALGDMAIATGQSFSRASGTDCL